MFFTQRYSLAGSHSAAPALAQAGPGARAPARALGCGPVLVSTLERLIPRALLADVDTRRRAQLTIGVTVTVIAIAIAILPVLVGTLVDPALLQVAVANTLGTVLLAALSPLLIRHRHGLLLAGNWVAALLLAGTVFAVLTGGGIGAPFWVLLLVVPVLAVLIAGQASGVAWLTMSILFILGLYAVQRAGVEIANISDPSSDPLLTTVATAAVLTVLTVLTLLSETTKREAIAKIAETSRQLALAIEDEQRSRDAAARASAASAAKSAFLTTMSHELRTPLNAILGYSEIILENLEARGDDEDASDVRKIHSAGQHLLGLINDVLDLSRIEAQRFELCAERFELVELVGEIEQAFEPLVSQSGSALAVVMDAGIEPVFLDKGRVRQILDNLLGNAVKFTRNGQVWLRVVARPGEIEFVVEDNGIGIPAEKLEQIFEPFMQIDSSFTRRHDGTGLGLAICRRLCGLMGGSLRVRSTLGQGSAFTVRLPRVTGEEHDRSSCSARL